MASLARKDGDDMQCDVVTHYINKTVVVVITDWELVVIDGRWCEKRKKKWFMEEGKGERIKSVTWTIMFIILCYFMLLCFMFNLNHYVLLAQYDYALLNY